MAKVKVTYADGSSEVKPAGAFRKRRPRMSRRARSAALQRDGYRCRCCKGREELQAHHLTYVRFGRERVSDLITLCQRCHSVEHQWLARQRRARAG